MNIINSLNKVLLLCCLILIPLAANAASHQNQEDYIVFLNIGQGDSTLICIKSNECGLIDTGKQGNVIQEIKNYTSKELNFILLTHPDSDHTAETIQILNEIGSKQVFFSYTEKGSKLIEQIRTLNNTRIYELRDNNDFSFGGYKFDVLWPNHLTSLNQLESNDTSTTLIITNKNKRFFMAGDLGSRLELINQKEYNINNIDVLKLSHHGSKNSSSYEFLSKLNPKLAIIPVGKNSYGHPTTQVLENLDKLSLPFLRTDKDGDIKISIFEEKLDINTQISKKSYIILN